MSNQNGNTQPNKPYDRNQPRPDYKDKDAQKAKPGYTPEKDARETRK